MKKVSHLSSRQFRAAWLVAAAIFLSAALFFSDGSVHSTSAQGTTPGKPIVRQGRFGGTSRAVRDLPGVEPSSSDTVREIPLRHLHTGSQQSPQAPTVKDTAVQSAAAPNAPTPPPPIVTFDGIDAVASGCSCLPPDTNGDVGPTQYVQMVNTAFQVYTKTGTPLLDKPRATNSLWNPANGGPGGECFAHNDGDPVVIYDHLADRWLLSQFIATPNAGEEYGECIAISVTPDATGAYYLYEFLFGSTVFYDYPHFGLWPDAYYMSANEFPQNSETSAGSAAFAFERGKMLAGQAARVVIFDAGTYSVNVAGMLPSDLDGPPPPAGAPNYFAEIDSTNTFGIPFGLAIWNFHVDWSNPSNSTFGTGANLAPNHVLPVTPFVQPQCVYGNGPNCVPQKLSSTQLDTLGDRLMFRLQYRNFLDYESLVSNHSVVVVAEGGLPDRIGIRWYEIRSPGGLTPLVYQQSTYTQPDTALNPLWRWMGSAALNVSGDLAIGFSSSGTFDFPALRYAGRRKDDPANTLAQGEQVLFQGTSSQSFPLGRWGDYSDLTVDPADDCTFWYTNEYYSGGIPIVTTRWRTRIGSFELAPCRTPPSATSTPTPTVAGTQVATSTPTRTPTRTVTVTPTSGPAPNPTYTSGNITFGPAVVIDTQRTEGEPVNHLDKDDNYWESGPWGFSTSQSFIHRSIDGGNQFNVVSPIGLRPNSPPGGGDTDIITDDQGYAYFADLEGLEQMDCSVSNDGGNSWRKNPVCAESVGGDRQWLAVDNGIDHTVGATGAGDNLVFVTYRQVPTNASFILVSPGSTGPTDAVGGVVYVNTTTGAVVTNGSSCGQLRFEPVNRNIYLPCITSSGKMQITRGHINLRTTLTGLPTDVRYTNILVPSSNAVGNLFSHVTFDAAGNLYATWIDTTDNQVYYAYSNDQGNTWSSAIRVSQAPANTNVFVWNKGGATGNLVMTWYGTSSTDPAGPSGFTSWYADRVASTNAKWFGFVTLVTNANTLTPNIEQDRFTEKPMHYGQVCLAGLLCTTDPTSDRTMADYFAVNIDNGGRIRIVYDDTTSQHHGAHLFEERQLAGPSPLGGTLSATAPLNPISDPTGDAHSPHYDPAGPGPGGSAGPNQPQLDFTQVRVSQITASTLQVKMTLDNLSSFLPPPGKANAFWITRFQAKSVGEGGEESYRIFYLGAESIGGLTPTLFAGSGKGSDPTTGAPGNGCVTTTPKNCKVVQYPHEMNVNGTINGNTICIEVPNFTTNGFGTGRPIGATETLYNVTAFSGGRDSDTDVYTDVDATRGFDFALNNISGTPCAGAGTPVSTASPTATSSPSRTATMTQTSTPTATSTPSRTATMTQTFTPTPKPDCPATPAATPTATPAATHTVNAVQDSSDSSYLIKYDGWCGVKDAGANGGTYRASKTQGDTISFKFTGTSITWVTLRGPDEGNAQISIDGTVKGTENLYFVTRQYNYRKTYSGLANRTHTIVVKVLGTRDALSSDNFVPVDAFIVGSTTTQDSAWQVQYNRWAGVSNSNASGGTYRHLTDPTADARFKFYGSRIDWITAKGPTYGMAQVFIDGTNQGTFDLYAPTQQWKVAISFTGLSEDLHKIEVKPTGTKNASSSGAIVVLDAFQGPIRGEPQVPSEQELSPAESPRSDSEGIRLAPLDRLLIWLSDLLFGTPTQAALK